MVNGRVLGMMSGMAITIWPGDRPFWVASWMSPARRNIPVRATRDMTKTLTSSARIIRLMEPKYTRLSPASLANPAHEPADRVDDPGQGLLGHLRRPVTAQVAVHPDAEQVAAHPGRQVPAVAE